MGVTDAPKNLNFQFDSRPGLHRGSQLERVLEYSDGIAVRKPPGIILGRKHQAARGLLVIPSFFEMQRKFRGQLPLSSRADRHQPLTQTPVKSTSIEAGETSVESSPVEGVHEFVMSRNGAIRGFVNSKGPNELLTVRELVARFFDCRRRGFQHRGDGPNRKTLTGHAAALEDALFLHAQLLELGFQHLLKRLRDTGIDILERPRESPSTSILRDRAVLLNVPYN